METVGATLTLHTIKGAKRSWEAKASVVTWGAGNLSTQEAETGESL